MQPYKRTSEQQPAIADGLLVQQTLAGDQDAFAVLVRRYTGSLYSYARKFLKDEEQVCDVVQKVFIRLYISLPKLQCDSPLKPWLYQVTHNCCIDEIRSMDRRHILYFSELEVVADENELPILEAVPDNDPLPEELVEYKELQRCLQLAIQSLPIKYRSVVLLRYEGKFTFPEIGQILHLPTSTVKTCFQRAKPYLREALLAIHPCC